MICLGDSFVCCKRQSKVKSTRGICELTTIPGKSGTILNISQFSWRKWWQQFKSKFLSIRTQIYSLDMQEITQPFGKKKKKNCFPKRFEGLYSQQLISKQIAYVGNSTTIANEISMRSCYTNTVVTQFTIIWLQFQAVLSK